MAVRSLKNHYRGINAHLHSLFQHQGGWDEFHTSHIVHLSTLLKTQLRPMGYTAAIEQSLQIRRNEQPAGKPKSDVTLYDLDKSRSRHQPVPLPADTHQLVLDLPDVLENEEELAEYRAIGVYEFDASEQGDPVAWIELLSPSNKPSGQDDIYYRKKRRKLLESGIVFVEIDYLHESPPTFPRIESYRRKSDAHPYRIIVVDPRPSTAEGKFYASQFDVDDPIPVVNIPLNGEDILKFDFGVPYTKTFEEVFYGDLVDYSQLPLHFDRYSESDQLHILTRMLTVIEAQDLEQAPLPLIQPPASVEEGLKRLQGAF